MARLEWSQRGIRVDRDYTALFLMTHALMIDSSLELLKYLIGEYWGGEKKKKLKSSSLDNALVKRRFVYASMALGDTFARGLRVFATIGLLILFTSGWRNITTTLWPMR